MNVKAFDITAARRCERMAKVGTAIEAHNSCGERLGIFWLHENAIADHLWNRGSSDGYNRLAGSHRFQKDDAEAFLQAWQTEHMRSVIFLSQSDEW